MQAQEDLTGQIRVNTWHLKALEKSDTHLFVDGVMISIEKTVPKTDSEYLPLITFGAIRAIELCRKLEDLDRVAGQIQKKADRYSGDYLKLIVETGKRKREELELLAEKKRKEEEAQV